MSTDTQAPARVTLAMSWASAGYKVFPCRHETEEIQTRKGTETRAAKTPIPRNGFHAASRKSDKILDWWMETPDALVGVVPASGGAVVIDVDDKSEGKREYTGSANLSAAGVDLTGTRYRSLSGTGSHFWYSTDGDEIGNALVLGTTGPVKDVDVRSSNGYVVVPYGPPAGELPPVPSSVTFSTPDTDGGDPATAEEVAAWQEENAGEISPNIYARMAHYEERFKADRTTGTLGHADALGAVWAITREAVNGSGAAAALDRLAAVYTTTEDGATVAEWTDDWDKLVSGAIGKRPAPDFTAVTSEPAAPDTAEDLDDVKYFAHMRMAVRFRRQARGRVLHAPGFGWHAWDGTRWKLELDARTARRVLAELLKDSWMDAMHDKDLAAAVRSASTSSGQNGVLSIASTMDDLSIPDANKLDADPYLLTCENGTLDLRTLTLRPHDPKDYITKSTMVSYRPGATSARWTGFITGTLKDDDARGFLQRYLGQALIGEAREHVMVIATGTGRNGKGVTRDAVSHAMGDYAGEAPPDMLMSVDRNSKRGAGELSAILDLKGTRLAAMSETDRHGKLDEALMKNLTGGDAIKARHLYQSAITFKPTHSFLLLTNHLPNVDGSAKAVWDRLRVVDFPEDYSGREDRDLQHDLSEREAAEAILSWIVEGLRSYWEAGGALVAPESVIASTTTYRDENDPVSQFVEDRCTLHRSARVTRRDLYEAYTAWCEEAGANAYGRRRFVETIRAVPGITERNTKAWEGIELLPEESEFSAK